MLYFIHISPYLPPLFKCLINPSTCQEWKIDFPIFLFTSATLTLLFMINSVLNIMVMF